MPKDTLWFWNLKYDEIDNNYVTIIYIGETDRKILLLSKATWNKIDCGWIYLH